MSIEVVFEKRISNATVYRDTDVEQRRQCVLLMGLAAVFLLGLLFYGWQLHRWTRLGYEIESLQKQKDGLLGDQQKLVLERTTLERAERIDWIARNELGMVVAAPGQIVALTRDLPGTAPASPDDAETPLSAAKR
jgi:cell division protein FtsL